MAEAEKSFESRLAFFAAAHPLPPTLVARWQALGAQDAAALLVLAERLRLGENHLRDFLDWAEEIAMRDDSCIATVLASEPVRGALGRDLGRNEAIKAVREALRRLRYPRLVAAEEDLARRLRALALPAGVRASLPPNLDGTELRFEIRAADVEQARAAVEALRRVLDDGALAAIYAALSEAP